MTWSRLQVCIAWRHPEWWCVALTVVAWVALAAPSGSPSDAHQSSHDHVAAAGQSAATWLLMVVAMMFPLVIDPIRTTAERSLWRRRHRAIAGFLIGYLVPWMMLGVCAAVFAGLVPLVSWYRPQVFAAAGFAAAAVWHLAPIRHRARRACHRTIPLAPAGWRADLDCLRFGWTIGVACVATCWALMLACLLVDHSLSVMACIAIAGAVDRYAARPAPQLTSATILSIGLIHVAVAGLTG